MPAPGAGRRAAGVFRGLLFGARRARGGVPFQHSGCGYGHVTWLVFLPRFLGRRLHLMLRDPMGGAPILTFWHAGEGVILRA